MNNETGTDETGTAAAIRNGGPASGGWGIDTWLGRCVRGDWLPFLPERLREPVARVAIQVVAAAAVMLLVAPLVDARGEAWLDATFARTLGALAATRGLDSAISLAQSSEVSFSFGPGGSLGIGQALDPVNDLVEQYAAVLLTSTTALGVQQLGMRVGRALGWWVFLPAGVAALAAAACVGPSRETCLAWSRRLFGIALFVRLAIPAAGWIDSLVADRFLESNYQTASAMVADTAARIEQVEKADADRPWYERYNPVDAIGDRAQRLYDTLAALGESIVNLAIYFTVSTIVLPLATLWLLSRVSGIVFASQSR
ncbi:MAG: hypothetical protein WCC69_05470 [Pirellulales bacterium]